MNEPNIELKIHDKLAGITPEEVKQCVLRFLQDYFASPGSKIHYDPDPALSELMIADIDPDEIGTNTQPMILVNFGGAQWSQATKDQYLQNLYIINEETGDWVRKDNGKRVPSALYSDLLVGGIMCTCRDRGKRAIQLATMVFLGLTIYKQVLRHMHGFYDIDNIRIGPERTVKADSDEIMTEVDVTFSFKYQLTWTITQDFLKGAIERITTYLGGVETFCVTGDK